MKRIFTLGKLIIVLFVVLVGLGIFIYTYPVKTVTVKSLTTDKSIYNAGDQLSYTVDRCKYVDNTLSGSVSRYLVSATNKTKLPFLINTTKTGTTSRGCGIVHQTILLQTNIPPDLYRLQIISSYNQHIWFKQPIVNTITSNNTFEVK